MKQGKVLEKLAQHKKVESIVMVAGGMADVTLKEGFFHPDFSRVFRVGSAHAARQIITAAKPVGEGNKVVKNIMTGKNIEIAKDTPRCSDPSSELYWSM